MISQKFNVKFLLDVLTLQIYFSIVFGFNTIVEMTNNFVEKFIYLVNFHVLKSEYLKNKLSIIINHQTYQ
jgi:flagellar biosynthesis protein FliQ